MANDKKSFVLYADLLTSVEHLTNEELGILFRHLLEYVNDQDPVLSDRLLLTAWKPIERSLKEDLKKWEDTRVKRAEAGAKGGLAKQANAKIAKQNLANQAVSVTVTDSVTVSDNVIQEINSEPFGSGFLIHWNNWLGYKQSQHRFKYKSIIAEQTAFNKLASDSGGDKLKAIELLSDAMANGWKGWHVRKSEVVKQTQHRYI
jgi:hypothetical protein